jgi:phenylalanyl-tRNA synthetase beta chain
MHVLDVVEDVAISFGFDNLESLPLDISTTGSLLPIRRKVDVHRSLWVGLGFQEVYSPILSNKDLLSSRMNVDFPVVEIDNFMSQTYSCVRSWLLPVLLDVLSKNKHVDYPQRVFEQGLVTKREGFVDEEHLSAVSSHPSADYTEMRQFIEFVLSSQGIGYEFSACDFPFFIPGRSAKIFVGGKEVGFLGELHPSVLENFGVVMPVVGLELDLSVLW